MQKKAATRMLLVLFGASFIAAFNENIVNVGLVDIMAEFAIDSATAQWLVTGYMIVTAIVVTLMAFLMKRFSVRALFFAGSALLVAGSIGAAIAPSFPLLLTARLLQAGGTGIFIPAMMNTVLAVAPKSKLGTYLSIGACTITFGPALAPVVSGLMVTMIGWRSVFAVPAVSVAALAVCAAFFVKRIAEPQHVRFDVPSLLLSCIGLTLFVVGLGYLTSNLVLAAMSMVLGIVCIVLFARRQDDLDEPMINLNPLRNPRFSLACAMVVVAMMTTFSMSVLLPLYFEGAVGTTALMAGVLILLPILVNAATTVAGGRVMDRKGSWPLLPIGFLIITAGQLACALLAPQLAVPMVVGASVVVYAGVGLVFSPSQAAGLSTLSREEHPHGVGIMSTFVQIAACIGPSLFVGILSSTSAGMQASSGAAAAQAAGFSAAVMVAAAIAAAGFIVSWVYARTEAKRAAVRSAVLAADPTLDVIMKTNVFSVPETATVLDVMKAMLEHETSGLPVMDKDQHVVGFVSDGDIMRAMADQTPVGFDLTYCLVAYEDAVEGFDARMAKVMGLNVMDLATENVVSVDLKTPVAKVCKILGPRKIKKVPVVSEGKLVGTVSRGDVNRFLMTRSMGAGTNAA